MLVPLKCFNGVVAIFGRGLIMLYLFVVHRIDIV